MSLDAFVSEIHAHYIAQFDAFLRRQRGAAPGGESEAKLQMKGPGPLFRGLHRADYLITRPERQIVFLKPDETATFDPFEGRVGEMRVRIDELRWDQAAFACDGGALDENAFLGWYAPYFDVRGARRDARTGLANAIHSAEIAPAKLTIDFGTAPPEALYDLLTLLSSEGVSYVRIAAQ